MQKSRIKDELKEGIILGMVKQIRRKMPVIGGRKLYWILKSELRDSGIKLGRDKFFNMLNKNELQIKRKKYKPKTTNSNHPFRKYENLIKDVKTDRSNQVFVSDITYLKTLEGFCYLFLITDLYSRKIVGYNLSKSLSMEGAIKALELALEGVKESQEVIHHSDRGIQYCSKVYTDLLTQQGIKISMAEQGNPYENAVAERVNGILKEEFMLSKTFNTTEIANKAVEEAIYIYNNLRPHLSLDYLTPEQKYAA